MSQQEWYRDSVGEINFGPSFAGYPATMEEINFFNSELAAGRATKLRSGTILYETSGRVWSYDSSGPTGQFVRRATNAEIVAMMPIAKLDQNTQLTTAADGTFTWTFATPFPTGVVPNIQLTPQDSTAGIIINHKISTPTNLAVSGRVDRLVDVTIVGIHAVGITASAATRIHLRAIEP